MVVLHLSVNTHPSFHFMSKLMFRQNRTIAYVAVMADPLGVHRGSGKGTAAKLGLALRHFEGRHQVFRTWYLSVSRSHWKSDLNTCVHLPGLYAVVQPGVLNSNHSPVGSLVPNPKCSPLVPSQWNFSTLLPGAVGGGS